MSAIKALCFIVDGIGTYQWRLCYFMWEIEGNEVADRTAKEAAAGEFHGYSESRPVLSRTSMAYLKRHATGSKSRGTKEWIKERTKQRWSYIPP